MAGGSRGGVGHFVPFWTRYVPVCVKARELVRQGVLGQVRAVVYRWHNARPLEMPITWRDDATLSYAGSVADVGSHAYDTLRWMLDGRNRSSACEYGEVGVIVDDCKKTSLKV